jgi:hypothetical protein
LLPQLTIGTVSPPLESWRHVGVTPPGVVYACGDDSGTCRMTPDTCSGPTVPGVAR